MKEIKLSRRLSAAAELCRDESFIADVGTDHAYLPIFLAKQGKIRGGVTSDINEGPIERARAHIAEHSLSDILTPVLTDGLSGLEKYEPNDIFILGMGGELIARIIEDAPFVKKTGTRLILQPMTHAELLRERLLQMGFSIIDERLVKEEKIYVIILAEYSGKTEDYNQIELLLGKINIEKREPLLFELARHTERVQAARIQGKKKAGLDTSYEEELSEQLRRIK